MYSATYPESLAMFVSPVLINQKTARHSQVTPCQPPTNIEKLQSENKDISNDEGPSLGCRALSVDNRPITTIKSHDRLFRKTPQNL